MILRTIKCDVNGCGASFQEEDENAGFQGWGHIKGVFEKDDNGNIRDTAYLCPDCLKKAMVFLNEGNTDDVG